MIFEKDFGKIVSELNDVNSWFNKIGIKTEGTRFQTLKDNIGRIHTEFENGSVSNEFDKIGQHGVYYSLAESESFLSIHRVFSKMDQNHLPKRKLTEAVNGPFFPMDEISGDKNVNPRNTLFELELASFLIESGIEVIGFEDVNFKFDGHNVSAQCKRVFSKKSLGANLAKAYDQLLKNNNLDGGKGIIAISADKLFGIDRLFLKADSRQQIDNEVASMGKKFNKDYHSLWREIRHKNMVAIYLVFKFVTVLAPKNTVTSVFYIAAIPLFEQVFSNIENVNLFHRIAAKLTDNKNREYLKLTQKRPA